MARKKKPDRRRLGAQYRLSTPSVELLRCLNDGIRFIHKEDPRQIKLVTDGRSRAYLHVPAYQPSGTEEKPFREAVKKIATALRQITSPSGVHSFYALINQHLRDAVFRLEPQAVMSEELRKRVRTKEGPLEDYFLKRGYTEENSRNKMVALLRKGVYTEATLHFAHKSFRSFPRLEWVPEFNPDRPVGYLWGLAACLLQDISQHPERLKSCQHSIRGKPCSRLFWDEAKNKSRKFCYDPECLKDYKREKVERSRKKPHKETQHGKSRR
ncbi:MAG TPA: hypothetical protein VLY20_12535 [Nitrospiria bacterium]|nr:hypothetical protein [Nitrospiria bacterium]